MSFSFGQPATTTTAPAFGTNTLSGGNLFGGGDSKTFQSPSNTDNKIGFFSSPTTSAPAFSNFAFGAKTTAATPGFFASPTTTTASTAFGTSKPLSFGGFTSPPNQTVGSPGFGQQQQQQNAPQNLSFGQTTITQQQAPPAFGTPSTQAPAFGSPSNSSLSLTKPTNQQTTSGFSFTPTSGFSMPQQQTATTTAQPAQSSFSLTPVTTSASGFGQSTPSFGQMFGKQSFSFAPTTSATGTTTATTTSAAPAFGSTAVPSFGLGQQSGLSIGQVQTAAAATTAAPFQFSQAPTSASFTSQPAASQQPTSQQPASQAQPKLSFAPAQATSASQPTTLMFGGGGLSKPPATSGLSLTSQAGPAQTTAPTSAAFGVSTTTSGAFGVPTATSGAFGVSTPASGAFGVSTTTSGAFGVSTATSGAFGASKPASGAFGIPTATTAATSQPATTGLGLATTSAALSFSKPAATSAAATSGTATSAPTGILSLGKSTATSTMPSLTTTTTTTASAPPQPISSITFGQLEENINKWTLELEEQEKIFINQATQINAWDRLLISNGEMIVELNDTIQTVKNEQQSLEHELDFVLAQQKELEEILTPIEKQLLNETGDRLRDPEREHMYSLAENLDSQLRQMSEDLKEVIEHLNETNRSQDTNDPIVQIGRILNAHMSSMQWIDNSIAQISTKLDQLKATHDTLRRDNERSFQLTYN
ncbi:unnamed protein product, partial [Iphiclides podalirius]